MRIKVSFFRDAIVRGAILFGTFFFWMLFNNQTAFAGERALTLLGVYSQSRVTFELDTQSPFYVGGETQNDTSINYGVLLEMPVQNLWGFETGLLFLNRGYQYVDSWDPSVKNVARWKSFYVPFQGRFHPTPTFTGSIGLYMAQGVGQIAYFQTREPNDISYQSFKQSGYRSFDWGMTYSAGLNIHLNASTHALLEIRFNESWSNFMDTSLPNIDQREKATLHEAQLILGLII